MEILKYLQSMLPNFEKAQILEDIDLLKKELQSVINLYETPANDMKSYRYEAKSLQEFQKQFDRKVDSGRVKGNYISVVFVALGNANDVLKMLENQAEAIYKTDVIRDNMTFLKVNVLQLIESISFYSQYASKLLTLTYRAETNHLENNISMMGKELKAVEQKYMMENMGYFFQLSQTFLDGPDKVKKTLKEIPDMAVDADQMPIITKTVGLNKLDPFKFGFIPVRFNPIYHVRMAVAEYQVQRYKTAQEERKMLELRLLHLKDLVEGVPVEERNAKLQQQIEYNETRLEKLKYKLIKMEEDYA